MKDAKNWSYITKKYLKIIESCVKNWQKFVKCEENLLKITNKKVENESKMKKKCGKNRVQFCVSLMKLGKKYQKSRKNIAKCMKIGVHYEKNCRK